MNKTDFKPPRVLLCYVCAKEFKIAKLKAHIPKCLENFIAMQSTLQLNESLPFPEASDDYKQLLQGAGLPKERIKDMHKEIIQNSPMKMLASVNDSNIQT